MKNSILVLGLLSLLGVVSADATYLYPNGIASGASAWTAVGCTEGATEYQCVDESALNVSDYLMFTTASGIMNSSEWFTLTNLPADATHVDYVRVSFYAKRYDATHYRFYSRLNSIGGYEFAGPFIANSTVWSIYSTPIYNENPTTGEPWTVWQVNNLALGMETLGPFQGAKVARVQVLVAYHTD